jgi:multidrug transporter EmrE-like cation transporter
MIKYIPMILFGVALNALAQLLLKQGMIRVGQFEFTGAEIMRIAPAVGFNPYIAGGLLSYVVSVVVWMLVLSRVDVSVAYPFLSVGYIVTAIGGWFFFAEHLSASRIVGIGLVCLGVVFLARS